MGVLLDFLLFILFVAVPVVALCLQVIPRRLDNVTFRDTDLDHAWLIVAQYAQGTFEQRFGYPTGYFFVDDKRSRPPERLLVREAQPSGAITDGCSLTIGSMSMSGFDAGCGAGCLMFFTVIFIGAPFLIVSMLDRFFRLILRSRVDVALRASGPDTIASFAFHGPGGYSLRTRYGQVFEKPVLPVALTGNPQPAAGAQSAVAPGAGVASRQAGSAPAGGRHASGPRA